MYHDIVTGKKKLFHIEALLRCYASFYRVYLMGREKLPRTQVFLIVMQDKRPDSHELETILQQTRCFIIIVNNYQQALHILDDIVPDVMLFADEVGKDDEQLFRQVTARCKSHHIPTFQLFPSHTSFLYKHEAIRMRKC